MKQINTYESNTENKEDKNLRETKHQTQTDMTNERKNITLREQKGRKKESEYMKHIRKQINKKNQTEAKKKKQEEIKKK